MKQLQIKRKNTVITERFKYIFVRMLLVVCASCVALSGCSHDDDEPEKNIESGGNFEENKNDLQDETLTDADKPDDSVENNTAQQDDQNEVNAGPSGNSSTSDSQSGGQTSSARPYKDPSLSSCWTKLESTAKAGQNYYTEYYTTVSYTHLTLPTNPRV